MTTAKKIDKDVDHYEFLNSHGNSFVCTKCKKTQTWKTLIERNIAWENGWRTCKEGCMKFFCICCMYADADDDRFCVDCGDNKKY